MRRLAAVLCVLIYLGGVIVFAWPDLNSLKTGYENKKVMERSRIRQKQNKVYLIRQTLPLPIPTRSQRTPSSYRRCRHIISRSFQTASQD